MDNWQLRRRDFLWAMAGLSGSLIASQLPMEKSLAAVRINGAGASFPAPLYTRWFVEYNKINKNVQVNYQSVGSGAGVKQFMQETVDFGASDVAMTDEEIKKVSRGCVMLPVTAGSIVVAYNMPGVNLKLSRQQLADVFLGKITNWNKLGGPNQDLKVVHRSDGSGTTAVFTKHLDAINGEWRSKVGTDKTVQWPTGIGAKGNEGVTATIQQTKGAIGYIEYGYAKTNNLATAQLQNKAGKYVPATLDSAKTTLSQVQLPGNLRAFIVDPSGDGSYPIVTYTWILAYKKYPKADVAQSLKSVFKWAVTEGQKFSTQLGYVPLPANVVTKVSQAIDTIG
jgi:phosphate transport system substrate-binding protein